jgi:uncharacterized protein (DUF1697 family)
MTRYIALLRGINVGGRNKVPMPALRAACESIGCTEVSTYIQSGNVVLTSALAAAKLGAELERVTAEQIGVAPAVMIRTHRQLVDAMAANPFPDADTADLHVGFLASAPDEAQLAAVAGLEHPNEAVAVVGSEVYFHLPAGMGRAKLPELFGRRVKIPATVRNWRTVTTLAEQSAAQ